MGTSKRKRPADRPPLGESKPEPLVSGRTEDQILLQQPFEVVLAGKPYTIALLPIRPAVAWRAKVAPVFADFIGAQSISTDDADAFKAGISKILVDGPEKLLDLFFEYAVDLDREEIEATANEWEIAAAFEQIARAVIAPPLLRALMKAGEQMG